jgi:hypothetical protein
MDNVGVEFLKVSDPETTKVKKINDNLMLLSTVLLNKKTGQRKASVGIGGTLTVGTIPKAGPTARSLEDSIITESGTTITVAGDLKTTGDVYAEGGDIYVGSGAAQEWLLWYDTTDLYFGAFNDVASDMHLYCGAGDDLLLEDNNSTFLKANDSGILVYNKIAFTQADMDEYIDSLNDGYLDYGATTGHRFNNDVDVTGTIDADQATFTKVNTLAEA